jgi:hypothetical protein
MTNLDEGTTLHVGPGLLGDLHDELVLVLDALSQNVEVDGGPHVVDVGHEAVLPAFADQLIQNAGIVERLVEVTVTGWIISEM